MFNLKYTMCRTCLEAVAPTNSINIFITEDLVKKLMSCTGQTVASTDDYPDKLCKKCYENIVMFYEFQQMCYKSLKTFLSLLKTEQASEASNNISEPYAGDNLQQDVEEQNRVSKAVIDEKTRERRSRKTKIFKNQKVERAAAAIKRPISSDVVKDQTTNDLEEYLQFDTKGVVNDSSAYPECLKEQDEANFSLKDHQVVEVEEKDEHMEQQPVEEIILTDAQGIETGQELTFIEKEDHKCHICSLEFRTLYKLQAHLRQHEGLPPYLCGYKGCASSFDLWHSYKKHLNDHKAREQSFKCNIDYCERVYKTKSNLNVHKRKYHNFGPELKTHMCEICGKVYKSSAVLNDHQFTHIDKTQLPYVCEEVDCGKRFSTKEKLKIHKMRHAGIKNFVCPHCGMRKTTRNELKIHINYHTLERTWPCRFCPKVCNSAGNLKMHIKNIHEGAKDFACRFCQRTFAKADTRKYHEMTHTGEKPNECKECGRRFVQPAALRTHRKIHLKQKENVTAKQKCKATTVKEANACIAENFDEQHLLPETLVAEILSDTKES